MKIIGLTGPSGAGKGTVAGLFASHGIPILDADRIYRELLLPPSVCLNALTEAFGQEILLIDGTLNRKKLAAIVFDNPTLLQKLNSITHKFVMEEVHRQLKVLDTLGVPAVVFDAPQLFEAGADSECDIIVSVLADEKVRKARICARDGISEDMAEKRLHAQYPEIFFREHSAYIIENNSTPEALIAPVEKILNELGLAKQRKGD